MRRRAEGFGLIALGLALGLALASYHASDSAWNVSAAGGPRNWLGSVGALWADAALQLLGLGAGALVLLPLALGGRRLAGQRVSHPARLTLAGALASLALAGCLSSIGIGAPGLPAGLGGVAGSAAAASAASLVTRIGPQAVLYAEPATAILFALSGFTLLAAACGAGPADWRSLKRLRTRRAEAPAFVQPRSPRASAPREAADELATPRATALERTEVGDRPTQSDRTAAKIDTRPRQQFALPLDSNQSPRLPPLSLLKPPPPQSADIDPAILQENARMLEQVLADYGVDGEIVHVRAGPVVTMYELEPAAGIKASRVIGLADDIARSMSAVSARVAIVPGRTIIGIELPNAMREMVSLSELLASPGFQDARVTLPLVLGKNIAGDPVIADLSPMPHLLIAGTTGSGKSVGLNAMILSLLYRLTPEQCRLIMIDPKQLELSVYDDIPHLLAPVVIEPPKAVRALKWAVEQMEERYRMMASIGVRSLAGFNQTVRDRRVEGQPFVRRVQTGFDPVTGEQQFEEQTFDYEPLPHIVVVVDELADLMMVAGKEIDYLIQRLAQKARAAGIHLILATQRPSVDVVTGTIKASLPTRISFQVTSKIDSRTILGEQGAEQLLGKGDMLYMPGGKQVVRVHGPFVSDDEVERVAAHWKAQGRPDYVSDVTEDPSPGDDPLGLSPPGKPGGGVESGGEEADLIDKATQLVAETQKASTSYLQRHFRIGYNNAARLIDELEQRGIVSPPDHVGRREVLVDRDGRRL
ncbi:MAG: DNA translocase FtsK 4TM domain-containing protein [Sphingomonadaceae bacterium]|nr:DNA translocase FtsK 4TM domain-containing protein [Sphingomonadaceae bacterium]